MTKKRKISPEDLRSRGWFNDPEDPGMTALYLERYLNYGLTAEELQSNRPIGIAQTGSDLAPCNRHHMVLAERVKDGIRDAGGIPLEFPIHPIQETGRRPTAAIDRNLQCISLTEILHGYPGSAEVVNMQAPAYLLERGIKDLPTMGDGRQSGTSSAPSILNISLEAAVGGGLGLLKSGDRIRVDLNSRTVDVMLSDAEMEARRAEPPYKIPDAQTWWQQEYRDKVSGLDKGAVFEDMLQFRDIAGKTPRHSH